MEIEQKARAYDEAIERAKKWYNAPNSDKMPTFANRVIEEIFPELCESEDERISKKIKKVLNWYRKSFSEKSLQNEEYDEMFAWLEKHGASIDVDSILNKVGIKPAYKDGNAWCILYGDNIQDGTCGFGDTKEDALVEFIKELLEEQGKLTVTKKQRRL